jgi:hypothetical protein
MLTTKRNELQMLISNEVLIARENLYKTKFIKDNSSKINGIGITKKDDELCLVVNLLENISESERLYIIDGVHIIYRIVGKITKH